MTDVKPSRRRAPNLVTTFTSDEVRVMHEMLREVQATGEFHTTKGDGGVQRSHIVGALCKFARLRDKARSGGGAS